MDATTTEALGLLRELELLEKLDCSSVTVESDSMELVQACNGTIQIRGLYTANLVECFLTAHIISSISFQHCPRGPVWRTI